MTDKPFSEQPDLHTDAPFRAALLTQPANLSKALRQAYEDPSKTLFGIAQGIPNTFVTKLIASTKPDFVWIDVEHGMYNRLTLHDCIHAAQHHSEGRTMVICRVPKHDEVSLSTALDAGAAGIVLPHCESAADVEALRKEMFYPPIGQRSFSPWTFAPGVTDVSLYSDDKFMMKNSNRHVVLIPQIESVKGVENAEEIAAVEGVGAMMFGPGDFMADAGLPMKMGGEPHPTFLAAMQKFAAAAAKYERPLFGAAQAIEQIPMLVGMGNCAVAVSFDVWDLSQLFNDKLKAARAIAADLPVPEKNETAAEETNGKAIANGNGKASLKGTAVPTGQAPPEA